MITRVKWSQFIKNILIPLSALEGFFLRKLLPVESITHFNGDQHRQGHGHGRRSLKDFTADASKVLVLIVALHEMRLHKRRS